jgi:hypothetical protein
MKKAIFISALLSLFSLNTFSQDEIIPIPEYVNTVYVITKDGLLPLEKQTALFKSRASILKFNNRLVIDKEKSNIRLKGNKIRFIYEPSEMVDPNSVLNIQLLVSNKSKNHREGFNSKTDINFNTIDTKPKIPFVYKKYKEKYILFEINNLSQGEYGIAFESLNSNVSEMLIQLFGID